MTPSVFGFVAIASTEEALASLEREACHAAVNPARQGGRQFQMFVVYLPAPIAAPA